MRTLRPGLSGDDPLATIRLPERSLSSQSLAWLLITQPEQPKDRTHSNEN